MDQNNLEYILDQVKLGNMTTAQANIEMVKMERVKLVTCSIPVQVRKVLNQAVCSGELAYKKKDGGKPEVYYHPSFEHLANAARSDYERKTLEALAKVCG